MVLRFCHSADPTVLRFCHSADPTVLRFCHSADLTVLRFRHASRRGPALRIFALEEPEPDARLRFRTLRITSTRMIGTRMIGTKGTSASGFRFAMSGRFVFRLVLPGP